MKRLLDIAGSLTLLLLLAPLLLLIATAIATSDGMPVFYRQQRVGRSGKAFSILKFRTMRHSGKRDASKSSGSSITAGESDSRITPMGQFLRQRRIDELPQLLNVLLGQMSFVGPRPEALDIYRKTLTTHPRLWNQVLSVRPGITGVDALAFKDEGSRLAGQSDPEAYYKNVILPEKLEIQRRYALEHSFKTDLQILFRTLGVLRG